MFSIVVISEGIKTHNGVSGIFDQYNLRCYTYIETLKMSWE